MAMEAANNSMFVPVMRAQAGHSRVILNAVGFPRDDEWSLQSMSLIRLCPSWSCSLPTRLGELERSCWRNLMLAGFVGGAG